MRHAFILLCLLSVSLPACSQSPEAATVVMVVRHAEKATTPADDPSLDEAGRQRAESLIAVAGEAGVTALYASQFKRTQETAAPLAAHLGLPVTTVALSRANLEAYPTRLAETILAAHRGEAVVVVNHSNTVPLIVAALGGASIPAITESDYDDFIIVIIPASGPVRTIRAQYGR